MSKKKVLITGCAGFIGFHTAQLLQAQGHEVHGLDNFNDYYSPALKRARAEILLGLGIPITEADICDQPELFSLIRKNRFTHLCHLAAQAGVRYSLKNPQAYVKTNLEGFVNILEACREFKDLKLVYASSSSVYGLNEKTPFAETDRTDRQASLYGVTKKTNELMAMTYHHLYRIPSFGLRFFTVYGPWGRPDMAYYTFTQAILDEKPIQLFNHGKMERDFTYVDDIVQGIAGALELEEGCDIFNLGNHQPERLDRFITILENELGKKAIREYLPMQKGDVLQTYADITHSQHKLKFTPKTSLEQGLKRFVSWYKEYALDPDCYKTMQRK